MLARVLVLLLLLLLPSWKVVAADPLQLTIVHFNDLDRMEERDGRGGLARVAAVIARARADSEQVLVTHGGDAISPSPMSSLDQGAHMIDLLNQLRLDLFVLGNHEFDFGPDILAERLAEAEFTVLGANAALPDGSLLPGVEARRLLSFGDWTLGVFGVVTPQTATSSSPGEVTFGAVAEAALEQASTLRAEGADFVIALAHTSAEDDLALIRQGAADLILGGHDQDVRLHWRPGSTGFVEAGSQGDQVTVIRLQLERDADESVTWSAGFEIVDTATLEPEPQMAAAVAGYLGQLDSELAEELAVTETALDTRREAVRTAESAFGNLVADALREATGAELALQNGGGIRGERLYPAGSRLSRRDILTELPFHNQVMLLEVEGQTLLSALEHGLAAVESYAGRFPHVAGMRITYDPEAPPGERVVEVRIGGAPLDLQRRYRLAVNGFTARGGDGYTMLAEAPRLRHAAEQDTDAGVVMRHLKNLERVAPRVEGRITPAAE